MRIDFIKSILAAITVSAALLIANLQAIAADLTGSVQGAGSPIAGSTVTLYAASDGAPSSWPKARAMIMARSN